MRRMHVTVTSMHGEVTQALREASRALAQSVTRRKTEIDMFYLLTVRLLLSSQRTPTIAEQIGIEKPIQVQSYRLTAECLEEMSESLWSIADTLLAILDTNKKLPETLANKFVQMSELAKSLCDDVMESYQSKDAKLVNEIIERYDSFKSKFTTVPASDQDSYDNELRTYVMNIEYNIRRIVDTGLTIAAVALERALEN
jgi:phosphate uptake regulator